MAEAKKFESKLSNIDWYACQSTHSGIEMGKKKRKLIVVFGILTLLVLFVVIVLKNTAFKKMPELQGEPQVGKWYRITPAEAKSSDGSEWHGLLRLGRDQAERHNYLA